jgi:predicted RNA-binding protein YlxR (DUF448 family)
LDEMNDRTCIVTRKAGEPDGLIRFVVGRMVGRSRSQTQAARPRLLGDGERRIR